MKYRNKLIKTFSCIVMIGLLIIFIYDTGFSLDQKPENQRYNIIGSTFNQSNIFVDSTGKAEKTISSVDMTDYINTGINGAARSGKNVAAAFFLDFSETKLNQLNVIFTEDVIQLLAENSQKKTGICQFGINSSIGNVQILTQRGISQLCKYGNDLTFSITKADASKIKLPDKTIIKNRPIVDIQIKAGQDNLKTIDGQILIEIPYEKLKEEDNNNLVAYQIDKDGKLTIVSSSFYERTTEKGKMLIYCNGSGTYAIGYREPRFADISGWSVPYINYVASRNIMKGTGNDLFLPNNKLTRGELAQILANIMEADLNNYCSQCFKDVSESAAFAPAISLAAEKGLVVGYVDGNYRPNQPITRQELAVILYRYTDQMTYTHLSKNKKSITFKDEALIADFAKSAVHDLQQAGIINGIDGNYYKPQAFIKRSECAKMINLLLKDISYSKIKLLPKY
jgi:hypothetical protein